VLKALREFDQPGRFHLHVLGEILDDEKRIKKEIRESGLQDVVTLHGFVTEERLDRVLHDADFAINLRYPTMGEASGSQLRIWAHRLPSMVTRVGWYESLPADIVTHISADESEAADIQNTLKAFMGNPARFIEMGERGRTRLETDHSPEAYARGLIEFAADLKRYRPQSALYELATRAGAALTGMYGHPGTEAMLKPLAEQIHGLG
jgi:glycosyltransferase involved in cell wall biosynthesis